MSIDRREFARGIVASAIATPAAVSQASGAMSEPDDPPPVPAPEQLLLLLKNRFGDRLSDEQWKLVRGKIEAQLATAKSLGEFKLQNSDEPATIFAANRVH